MDIPFPDGSVVHTDADLTALWQAALGELRFADRMLWMLVLGPGGRAGGPLLQVADLPDGPYDVAVEDLAGFVGDILQAAPGSSVALLIARPGGGPWHVGDRAWARFLHDAAGAVGATAWPVHRARDGLLEICEG